MKECSTCKKEKKLSGFYKNQYKCKSCCRLYYQEHKDHKKIVRKKYVERNKEKISEYMKKYGKRKRVSLKLKGQQYYKRTRKVRSAKQKAYYQENKKEILQRNRTYRQRPQIKIAMRKKQNEYSRVKKLRDPAYKLSCNMSTQIYKSLKENKNKSWTQLVNFDVDTLWEHLSAQFQDGMTVNNYGSVWHVDHIIPLKYKRDGEYYFNQEELADPSSDTFHIAWGLDNLQPMNARENQVKNSHSVGRLNYIISVLR